MNEVDDAILEFFVELDSTDLRIALPPTALYVNLVQEQDVLDKSPNTLSRRMKSLSQIGMLERIDDKRGYYRLTDLGVKYVHGELDADDIPRPDE